MKKLLIAAALILTVLICSGCSADGSFFPLQIEIDDVTVVRIIAFDYGVDDPDNIRVSVVIQSGSEPTSDGEGKKNNNTAILSCERKTISSATRALQEYVNKKLFYGHIDVCLIGGKIADDDIFGVMDFLSRDPEFRLNSYIFFTKGDAVDLLEDCDSEIYYLPERIINIADNMTLLSSSYVLRVQKLSSLLDDNDFSAIAMPVLDVKKKSDGKDEAVMTAPEMEIAAYAVVKGGRQLGLVEKKDMLGYNLISGKIKFPTIDVETDDGVCVALEVVQGKTSVSPVIEGGELRGIKVRCEIHANINDVKQADFSINEQAIYELEDKMKDVLCVPMYNCIKTAQTLNADFIGANSAVFHKKPYVWFDIKDRYDEAFPTLNITVEMNTRIDRTYDTRDTIRGRK